MAAKKQQRKSTRYRDIATELQKEIEVPASPGGRSDEAFDLGTIELKSRQSLKAGKAAPVESAQKKEK